MQKTIALDDNTQKAATRCGNSALSASIAIISTTVIGAVVFLALLTRSSFPSSVQTLGVVIISLVLLGVPGVFLLQSALALKNCSRNREFLITGIKKMRIYFAIIVIFTGLFLLRSLFAVVVGLAGYFYTG